MAGHRAGVPIHRTGQQIAGIGTPALRPAMLQELLALAELALMHIGAARKRAAVAADHRDLGLGVEIEAPQRVGQMPDQLVAERVEPLRTVQGQSRDPIATSVFDQAGRARLCHPRSLRYLSSHTSSKRQPLYWLFVIIVSPLTSGCQQVAARR